jgi:hypothetical protein
VPNQDVVVIQDAGTNGIRVERKYGKLSVYPNPSTGFVNIDYFQPERATVQLTVYDMMGKVVKQNILENQLPGSYHTELNLNEYSNQNGVYYVRLTYGDKVFNSKVIIAK